MKSEHMTVRAWKMIVLRVSCRQYNLAPLSFEFYLSATLKNTDLTLGRHDI